MFDVNLDSRARTIIRVLTVGILSVFVIHLILIESFAMGDDDVDKLITKGNSLYGFGRYEESITYFDKVLAINPNNPNALYNKGQAYYMLGNYQIGRAHV